MVVSPVNENTGANAPQDAFNSEQSSNAFKLGKPNPFPELSTLFELSTGAQTKADTLSFQFTEKQLPNGWHKVIECRDGQLKAIRNTFVQLDGDKVIVSSERKDGFKKLVFEDGKVLYTESNLTPFEAGVACRNVGVASKIVQQAKLQIQNDLVAESQKIQSQGKIGEQKGMQNTKGTNSTNKTRKTWFQSIKGFIVGAWNKLAKLFSSLFSYVSIKN